MKAPTKMYGRYGGKAGVMCTYNGSKVNLMNFKSHMIDVQDIGHALSKQCRFNGHINRMYTVAEHSIVGGMLATSPELRLECLLHDAAEAYTGDVILPFKEVFPEICEIEDAIGGVIFNTLWPNNDLVVDGKYVKSRAMSQLDKYMGMCESMQFRPHLPLLADQKNADTEAWRGAWFRFMQQREQDELADIYVERLRAAQAEVLPEDTP